jgi:hypothetical protein
MYYCRPENVRTIDGCDFLYSELRRSIRNRMTLNFAQYIQQLINAVVPSPNNKKDQLIKMAPFKILQSGTFVDIPEMMPPERRSKERHDPAASSSSSMRPKRGASRFLASLWQMCRNTNDVAHQSLALNQETRRRQNEIMAARNHHVPPAGPELELVVAPTWEMPPLEDAMFQKFDLSLLLMVVFLLLLELGLLLFLILLGPEMVETMMSIMKMLIRMAMKTLILQGQSSTDGNASIPTFFFAFLVFRCQRGRRE